MIKLGRDARNKVILGVLAMVALYAIALFGSCLSGALSSDASSEEGTGASWHTANFWNFSVPSDGRACVIDVSSLTADVVVRQGSGDAISVTEEVKTSSDLSSLSIDAGLTGRELKVMQGGGAAYEGTARRVTIELPKDVADDLDEVVIGVGKGDVTLSNLDCASLRVEADAGDVDLEDVSAEDASLTTGSGDVRVAGRFGQSLVAESQAGDVSVDCSEDVPAKLEVTAAAGDVSIGLPEDSGFTLSLDQDTGEFESGGFTLAEKLVGKGDGYLCGDGSAAISISAGAGDVRLLQN